MTTNPEEKDGVEGATPRLSVSQMAASGETCAPGAVSLDGRVSFAVQSFTATKSYSVTFGADGWRCTCPRWRDTEEPCKHVDRVVRKLDPRRPFKDKDDLVGARRRIYSQDWPAYDASQQAEHSMFDVLLWDLLEQIPLSLRPVEHMGRPEIPLRVQFLIAVKKVHLNKSSRRARGLMETQCAHGMGLLGRVPNYAVSSRLFKRPETAPLLIRLIQLSSLPLAALEEGGTVAIDSSGFCTTCRGSYCTEKHDPDRKHRWVKAHLAIGTRTHAVLAVKVTDEHGADCPEFIPLLGDVARAGFSPDRVVADKAYLSKTNLEAAVELDIDPYIPFKANSVGKRRSSAIWRKKFFEFLSKREEFDERYHTRSNVEATFSAIKRKLGEELYSHRPVARFNELLAKLLAYNIGIVIEQIFENGIDPGVTGISLPSKSAVSTACTEAS
jgi:transposase